MTQLDYRCVCGGPAVVRITDKNAERDVTLAAPCEEHVGVVVNSLIGRYPLLVLDSLVQGK